MPYEIDTAAGELELKSSMIVSDATGNLTNARDNAEPMAPIPPVTRTCAS